MALTCRNKSNFALKAYEIRIIAGNNAFGFRREEPVKARGEATYKDNFDTPQDVKAWFQKFTPLLCATGVEDETGKQTTYR